MDSAKKSFLVYADWATTFDMLSDEEAGRLMKHIMAYANDDTVELPLSDRILRMAFEPIRQAMLRDANKYEEVKKKRVEAGRNGGSKSGETRSKSKQNEANEANASNTKQNEANEAVNVNGIENVNDSVSDNESEKEKKDAIEVLADGSLDQTGTDPSTLFPELAALSPSNPSGQPNTQSTAPEQQEPPKESRGKPPKREAVSLPWQSEAFAKEWERYKRYRKDQHSFVYKSADSEQSALNELFTDAAGDESVAVKMINRSIANGWRRIVPFENQQNQSIPSRTIPFNATTHPAQSASEAYLASRKLAEQREAERSAARSSIR